MIFVSLEREKCVTLKYTKIETHVIPVVKKQRWLLIQSNLHTLTMGYGEIRFDDRLLNLRRTILDCRKALH